MKKCEFKQGIFIQRQCSNPAYHRCLECQIYVCSNHSRPIDNGNNSVLCHNCYLANNELDEEATRRRYLKSDADFQLWYSSFRKDYSEQSYQPLFDEQDYRDFEIRPDNQQAYLEEESDFFDS